MNLNFKTSRGESRLNKHLVEQQKLSEEDVRKIQGLHCEKDALYDQIEESGDPSILKEIEEVEFKLQDAWKFPRDVMYHRHWEVPGCSCPRLDSIDDYPYAKHYSGGCPLHGKKIHEL